MNKKHLRYLKYVLLIGLLYVPVFGYLDDMCFRIWDESRNATNAYEMVLNRDIWVTHFEGKPDMWNTKPPLLIWCQAFFIKCLGLNEIAIRLPSALSTFFTCMVLLFFCVRYFQSFWFGFCSILVLITSDGYVSMHGSRFGEYDSMVTFLLLSSCLCFYLYLDRRQPKFIYLFFLCTSLAVLTKSAVGLMFLPALFLYSIWKKQLFQLFTNKHVYIGATLLIILTGGYYLLREHLNPGYLNAVNDNEFLGRLTTAIEDHGAYPSFYIDNLLKDRFVIWLYIFPFGVFVGLLHAKTQYRDLTVLLLLVTITFFGLISYAKTKLLWYDIPLYPIMSLLAGLFITRILELIQLLLKDRILIKAIISSSFLLLVFLFPYKKVIEKTYKPKEEIPYDQWFFDLSYYLKDALKGKVDVHHQYLLYNDYAPHLQLYIYMLQSKGIEVSIKRMDQLEVGDVIFFSKTKVKNNGYFDYTIFRQCNDILICKVTSIDK